MPGSGRITLRFPQSFIDQLEAQAKVRRVSPARLVMQSVDALLNDVIDTDVVFRRFDRSDRRMARLARDLDILTEMMGTWFHFWFAHTPRLPPADRAAAAADASARMDMFMAEVAKRLRATNRLLDTLPKDTDPPPSPSPATVESDGDSTWSEAK